MNEKRRRTDEFPERKYMDPSRGCIYAVLSVGALLMVYTVWVVWS